ncbi:outer membrane lipoprotein-sorting protein [Pleionea litopenaei]|uniref:Outer membrane lipoprotein-sorting protein n=1 Tax=Pleionea litopenaei TaxID=3070815 RepID=A0AA51X5R6_9GAMM|nr:outer membrane lipoprotein-sorting protein [Pleionea sp. HL-JVS1]WMS85976.1 outer membrane lipoprotein-sorting protein [Pleionea sp. HL-JVS1]
MLKKHIILAWLIILPLSAWSQSAEEKGLEIAKEAERRNTGWDNSKANMLMTLISKSGNTSVRKIRVQSLEVADDGDKSLTIFDEPKDVQGTAFLSFSHAQVPDEQWLYLPALKRVKRISSSNKSGPFMGSEFSFEDLSSFELDKYQYKYIGDEMVDGQNVFVVESTPTYKHSGYTRLVNYIDQKEYRILKTKYYDRKNALLKTLTNTNYKQFLDKFWRAYKMTMENHLKGTSTILEWSDYEFKTGVDERDFNKNALKRIR